MKKKLKSMLLGLTCGLFALVLTGCESLDCSEETEDCCSKWCEHNGISMISTYPYATGCEDGIDFSEGCCETTDHCGHEH